MADSSIAVPNSGSAAVDVETVTTGSGTVNRQIVAIGDPATGGQRATVTAQGEVHTALPACATGTITSVAGATSATTLLNANTARKTFTVFNDSTATLYLLLGSGTPSTTNYTAQVAASGYYEGPAGIRFTGSVKAVWSSAVGNARITELSA